MYAVVCLNYVGTYLWIYEYVCVGCGGVYAACLTFLSCIFYSVIYTINATEEKPRVGGYLESPYIA